MLYFVVVARLKQAKKKLPIEDLQPIVDILHQRHLGGEQGYGVLQDRNTTLLFDTARSTAWFTNSAAHIKRWLPGTKRPETNLDLCISHAAGHEWVVWFRAKGCLQLGEPLFAPYGVGSSHHRDIRKDAMTRAADTPKCYYYNETYQAKCKQLATARQVRRGHLRKSKGDKQARPLRQAPSPRATQKRTCVAISEALMEPKYKKRRMHPAAEAFVWEGNWEGKRVRRKAIVREAAKLLR